MRTRSLLAHGLVAAVAAVSAAPATAAPATTFTETVKGVTESFPEVNECSGATGTVTITYNGVFHVTELASGGFHVTGTQTGTFTFVPDDPSEPTYTGRFTTWFGENVNARNLTGTFTFRVRGVGSDGSVLRFHQVAHFSVSATGVTVEFDRTRCF